jgi:hypothetical protein
VTCPRRSAACRLQVARLTAQFERCARAAGGVGQHGAVITKGNERSKEGWAPYARERRQIADVIARTGLTSRLVMLSGDAHMLALDDGTNSQYSTLADAPRRGFIVAHAAPMDRRTSTKGGPYTHAPVMANGQYGVLDVTDDGGASACAFRACGSAPVAGMRIEAVSEFPDASLRRDLRVWSVALTRRVLKTQLASPRARVLTRRLPPVGLSRRRDTAKRHERSVTMASSSPPR